MKRKRLISITCLGGIIAICFLITCKSNRNYYTIKYKETEIGYKLPNDIYYRTGNKISRHYRNHDNTILISVSLNTTEILRDKTMPFSKNIQDMVDNIESPKYDDYKKIFASLDTPKLIYNNPYFLMSKPIEIHRNKLLGEKILSLSIDDNKYLHIPFIFQSDFISSNGIVSVSLHYFNEKILLKMNNYGKVNGNALEIDHKDVVNEIYKIIQNKNSEFSELVYVNSLFEEIIKSLRINN